jgi:hypothetical protein
MTSWAFISAYCTHPPTDSYTTKIYLLYISYTVTTKTSSNTPGYPLLSPPARVGRYTEQSSPKNLSLQSHDPSDLHVPPELQWLRHNISLQFIPEYPGRQMHCSVGKSDRHCPWVPHESSHLTREQSSPAQPSVHTQVPPVSHAPFPEHSLQC